VVFVVFALTFLCLPFLLIALVVIGGVSMVATACGGGQPVAGSSVHVDGEQVGNALTIIGVAKAGFGGESRQRRAALVGLVTSVQESGLRNLGHGDLDSVGLFQQRPSMGWGSQQDIMNPAYAAARFYRGLAAVHGWETMAPGSAAQSVQVSGFPDAFETRTPLAEALLAELFPVATPTSIPQTAGWVGDGGSLASAAELTGGCVATGEI